LTEYSISGEEEATSAAVSRPTWTENRRVKARKTAGIRIIPLRSVGRRIDQGSLPKRRVEKCTNNV